MEGGLVFNPLDERLDLPLPVRLARQGFPFAELKEQMRMHQIVADFSNRMFYQSRLRNGACTTTTLEEDMPGLQTVLQDIIAPALAGDTMEISLEAGALEKHCHTQWIQVDDELERHPRTNSVKVAIHVEVFFNRIFPGLHRYFGESMSDKVMVICAYSYALSRWRALAAQTARQLRLSSQELPQVVTLDASQGQEAFMVIFDGSLQSADRLGFLKDAGRCNVAKTRARGVF